MDKKRRDGDKFPEFYKSKEPRKNTVRNIGVGILTTGDVAWLCRVAPRTVTKWIDTGRLRAYRVPSGKLPFAPDGPAGITGDRRIELRHLIEFSNKFGVYVHPIARGGSESVPLLAVGVSPSVRILMSVRGLVFDPVNPIEAATRIAKWEVPGRVILGVEVPSDSKAQLIHAITTNGLKIDTVVLLADDGVPESLAGYAGREDIVFAPADSDWISLITPKEDGSEKVA